MSIIRQIRVRGGQHHRFTEAVEEGWLGDESELILHREPGNSYDWHAIKVFVENALMGGEEIPIGYVAAPDARWLSPLLDDGGEVISCKARNLSKTSCDAILVLEERKESSDG